MGASMSALTSCRASRSDLRGSFRGFAVDKFGGALCVSGGGEHCSIVSSQDFQPRCDIGRMIFAGLKGKLQIGAQERGPKFSNQFLDCVTFAPEAMPAEVTVEPGLAARPMGALMGKGRVVTVRVLETLERRHLDRIGGDVVKRTVFAVSDGGSQGCEELFRELERTSALIENLMTLARADSGSEPLRLAPTNLNEILLEISEPARLLAEGKSIQYDQRLPETPVCVNGNAPSLRRLFLILIDNAVKYTSREGRISVVVDASDGSAVTEIRDTGVGISPTDLPHIFERFYRADESRSRESGGTGLGLSIAQWIVEAHKGKISVASKIGEGSVFRVQIPLSEDSI
jgi:signal transduction histidine kinase